LNDNHSRRGFLKQLSLSSVAGISVGSELTALNEENPASDQVKKFSYDLVVYGATSGGVIAAYTAKMYGLSVLLVEPGRHLGGMSSGGLGATDTYGKENVITGLAREFYYRVGQYYGKDKPLYRFEPKVAELTFNQYVNEANLDVFYSRRVQAVRVRQGRIQQIVLESSHGGKQQMVVEAHTFIDASYEGDLLARAGVSYTVGRESNALYFRALMVHTMVLW
jgi:flavin-dependent dehydrogenase